MGKQACSGCGAVPGKAQRKQAKRGLEVSAIATKVDFRVHYIQAHVSAPSAMLRRSSIVAGQFVYAARALSMV
eukprot:20318-Heterococcus_DN1.PRE.2